MRKRMPRMTLLSTVLGGLMAMGLSAPAQAVGNVQISGPAEIDAAGCDAAPPGFDDFPGLALHGSLEGCLYTQVVTSSITPSGTYKESGHETIVASLNGGPMGTFTTNYKFEGRCQHPIAEGSGTGGFAGATGRLDFKDLIGDPTTYVYRGHIKLG
jgi:hypothetical protein